MKTSERFALNQWLSDYPEEMTYQEVLDYLNDNTWLGSDDEVMPWELVENNTGDQIAHLIEDTRKAYERSTQGATA